VAIQLDRRPARTSASQGQQRSIVLAVKLAEIRYVARCTGATPVVMLDDVLSELDSQRRSWLLRLLTRDEAGAQVLVTTTERLQNVNGKARHFTIRSGTVTPDA
jgi:DNA replication and repair protein RecF